MPAQNSVAEFEAGIVVQVPGGGMAFPMVFPAEFGTPTVPELVALDIISAEVSLDDSRAPYVEARLVCHLPAEDVLEQLDPREHVRLTVSFSRDTITTAGVATQTRDFDLLLHEREIDSGAGELRLTCRSDEAILIDDMLGGVTVDDRAESVQASLRDIIDQILGDFGASLEPGDADADFTLTEAGRDADVLKREPGERAWDFLDSLIQSAGLRLFCDEQRAWRLVDPTTYSVPGSLRISEGTNVTAATDTIDLSAGDRGARGYAETVVVKYTWTDESGAQQVAYDAAGAAHGVGRLVQISRPYPGGGAAAAELRRSEGKGRVFDLEALADLAATPGQTLVATLPSTPVQVGIVSAVTWYWAADGDQHDVMEIRSRGLTDTPETAWVLQPPNYRWVDVPDGTDWTEYETPS